MTARRRVGRAGIVAAIALSAAGCLPTPMSEQARDVDVLYRGFLAVAAVIAVIVFGTTAWAVVRHRAHGPDDLPPQVPGNVRLEVIWTALPILTVLGLFAATVFVLGRVQAESPQPGAVVNVEAFRWGWTFRYPAAGVTVSGLGEPGPELVVPVGEPIHVTLTGVDVVHAFYVPQFLFKKDAIPGKENTFDFTVDDPGIYRGQCAEFCGFYHSGMPFAVRAVSRPEYDAWLAAQPRDPGAARPSIQPSSAPPASGGASPGAS